MPAYARGTIAWGACQRCGLRYLLRELVMDGYFPNLRVCAGCYDDPQPQERLAVVSDPVALWKPAIDPVELAVPFLTVQIVSSQAVLSWTSICGPPVGDIGGIPFRPQGSQGAYTSAGYEVLRSGDGVNFTSLVTLMNTADEFGALSIETLTYTDTSPPRGIVYYQVRGFDVAELAENE